MSWSAKFLKMRGPNKVGSGPGTVITLSGGSGTLASKVAEVVGQQFGYRVYLPEMFAGINGVGSRHRAQHHAEFTPDSGLGHLYDSFLEHCRVSDTPQRRARFALLGSVALEGNCIIVGDDVHALLAPCVALSIQCVASNDTRMHRVARMRGISSLEAERVLREEDVRRRRDVTWWIGEARSDATSFDLTISTDTFAVDQAAAIAVRTYRGMQGSKRGMPVKMLGRPKSQFEQLMNAAMWVKAK